MLVCWGCCVRLHVPPTVTHAHTHTDGPCHCLSWLLVWSQLWKHWPTTVLQRTCVWMGSSAAAVMHLCGAILGQQWVMFLQISTLKRIAGSLCNQRYSLCLPNINFFFFFAEMHRLVCDIMVKWHVWQIVYSAVCSPLLFLWEKGVFASFEPKPHFSVQHYSSVSHGSLQCLR